LTRQAELVFDARALFLLQFAFFVKTFLWIGQNHSALLKQRLRCAAQLPASRTWDIRGGGTHAASFSNRSKGESWSPVVPSNQARVTG